MFSLKIAFDRVLQTIGAFHSVPPMQTFLKTRYRMVQTVFSLVSKNSVINFRNANYSTESFDNSSSKVASIYGLPCEVALLIGKFE